MRISDWSSDVCSSDLDQLWEKRRHGYVRIFCHRVAERGRAVGGQLDDEAFGEWFDAVVLIVFFRFDGLAADGDDGALHRGARRADEFGVGFRSLPAIGPNMRHVFGADEAAIDRKRSVGVDETGRATCREGEGQKRWS